MRGSLISVISISSTIITNAESIGLLERQGIDLKKNREKGIDSSDFGRLVLSSGLVSNNSSITWIAFHGAYDFGFLIKILTKRDLPSDLRSFLGMMRFFFGVRVYDAKIHDGMHQWFAGWTGEGGQVTWC
ncbi:hypothetical protein OIU78_009351 [Salix suchowensis]|nr:hypothetical protein OIU78_009351 [Salix suchowensis]